MGLIDTIKAGYNFLMGKTTNPSVPGMTYQNRIDELNVLRAGYVMNSQTGLIAVVDAEIATLSPTPWMIWETE